MMSPGSTWRRGPLGVLSRGVLRIPGLAEFVGEWGSPVAAMERGRPRRDLVAVMGWGHRVTADAARALAVETGIPYLALEDGFLRSVGLGSSGVPPLSLIVDDVGMYYDASQPSRLEALIAARCSPPPGAIDLLDRIRETGLTKYNIAAGASARTGVAYVLDQTVGDISISGGAGDRATFEAMLDAAIREQGLTNVVVRVHPAVIAGHRKGYLLDYARRRGAALDTQGGAWLDRARGARQVYTVSSLGGFEAMIAGAPVSCFGLPFYAGWGLTDDRQRCPRRNARPTLEQVFAAAYWDYARYVDPVTGLACDALTAADRLLAARVKRRRPPLLARLGAALRR